MNPQRIQKKRKLPRSRGRVDIVLPLYNEVASFENTYKGLRTVIDPLPYDFELVCVDDGSTDGTMEMVQKISRHDKRVRLVRLSRNFGHQAALTAGLMSSRGEVVVTMDGDGQHPPELIPQMLELVRQGY